MRNLLRCFALLFASCFALQAQNLNLSNTTPAAPSSAANVSWQHDAASPVDVSAYISYAQILAGLQSFTGCGTANLFLAPQSGNCLQITYAMLGGTPPTWNQNTTGTAANITAASNSSLTTLTALSLPYSQLTGAPSIPSSASWPNAGACSAGSYVTAIVNGTAPTCGQVQYSQIGGSAPTWNQNTTGQAGTALALAATPTQCSGNQFAQGVASNGNANCATPSGSGNVSTGASNTYSAGDQNFEAAASLEVPDTTADPSTWEAGFIENRTDLGAFKGSSAAGSAAAYNSFPEFLQTANLYGLNTATPKQFKAITASIAMAAATANYTSPKVVMPAQQLVMGYIGDSLSAQSQGPNRNSYNTWEIQQLWTSYGYGGSGWVDAVGTNLNLDGQPPAYTTGVTLSPANTSNFWTYHIEGLKYVGSGGSLATDTRTPWGPANTDLNCNSGDSCSATVTCGGTSGYPCTEIVAYLYAQSGGASVACSIDSGTSGTCTASISTNGAAATPVYADTGALTAGSHTMTISGTGPWEIAGFDTINGSAGVKLERVAQAGSEACDFDAEQSATGNLSAQWAKLGINVANVMFSTNEQVRPYANYQCPAQAAYGRSPAQFFTDFSSLVTTVQGLTTLPDVTVSPDPDTWYSTAPTHSSPNGCGSGQNQVCTPSSMYDQMVVDYAFKNPTVGLIDAYALFHPWQNLCWSIASGPGTNYVGSNCTNTTNQRLSLFVDNVHLTDYGDQMFAVARLNYFGVTPTSSPISANLLATDNRGNGFAATAHNASAPFQCADTSSSATTYTCTTTPTLYALTKGDAFLLTSINQANSGASTLNIDGIGAVAIKKQQGTAALISGDLAASGTALLIYDGTNLDIGTIANSVNGGTVTTTGSPASGQMAAFSGGSSITSATAHNVAAGLACADTSGSGTAQSCSTSPSFTPAAGDCINYMTTTANTGAALTINVNSLGAKSWSKWLGTTTLAAGDLPANKTVRACYDGTNWNADVVGNAPSGGTNSPGGSSNSVQYNGGSSFGGATLAASTDPQDLTQTNSAAPAFMRGIFGPMSGRFSNPKLITLNMGSTGITGGSYTQLTYAPGEANTGVYTVPSGRIFYIQGAYGYSSTSTVTTSYDDNGSGSHTPIIYQATGNSLAGPTGYGLAAGHSYGIIVSTGNVANFWVQGVEADATSAITTQTLPGGSATTQVLYTVPSGTHALLLNSYFVGNGGGGGGVPGVNCTNTSGNNIVVTVYLVPTGQSTSSPPSWTEATTATVNNNSTTTVGTGTTGLAGGGSFVLTYGSAGAYGTFSCHVTLMTDTGSH